MDSLNNKINLAVSSIYERSTGLTQQEINRIIKKILLLCLEMIQKGDMSLSKMIGELKNGS